ncbi:MAG: molybdate ABC transporter substrate-binding protein [Chloroflexi bacterium]|nr:molybdate ABC transporter substrate-binding protein [Chloroflexota bacterium]
MIPGMWLVSVALLIVAAACSAAKPPGTTRSPSESGPVLVLAAASLSDALAAAGEGFEKSGLGDVSLSFAASGTLMTQVQRGAPGDVVIFAGSGPMDDLERDGLLRAGSRRSILSNRLVVITRSGGAGAASLEALAASTGRLAIADPDLAPAGQYARAALRSARLWDSLLPRIIPALDVREAAATVATGNADFGFVYATDAAQFPGVIVAFEVPQSLYPPVLYPAAIIGRSARTDAAARFLDYLASGPARAIFESYGFSPAPARVP